MIKGVHDQRYKDAVEQLRLARIKLGWSQTELASRLQTRQQFVSKFETGERRLDVIEFADIARCLGLQEADVLKLIFGVGYSE